MMNLFNALVALYGFEVRDSRLWWGMGSICNGMTVAVSLHGEKAVVEVSTFYCDGEVEEDTSRTVECHISRLWENLPAAVYHRR